YAAAHRAPRGFVVAVAAHVGAVENAAAGRAELGENHILAGIAAATPAAVGGIQGAAGGWVGCTTAGPGLASQVDVIAPVHCDCVGLILLAAADVAAPEQRAAVSVELAHEGVGVVVVTRVQRVLQREV